MDGSGDLSWTKSHKSEADQEFDRLAEERIERLRQRLDRYNAAIAEATASTKKQQQSQSRPQPGSNDGNSQSRPLPADGAAPSVPPGLEALLGSMGLSGTRPAARLPEPASGARSSSVGSTEFEAELRRASSQTSGAGSGKKATVPEVSPRVRTTVELEPMFEEVDASDAAGRQSFGVTEPSAPQAETEEHAGRRDSSFDDCDETEEEEAALSGDETDEGVTDEDDDGAPVNFGAVRDDAEEEEDEDASGLAQTNLHHRFKIDDFIMHEMPPPSSSDRRSTSRPREESESAAVAAEDGLSQVDATDEEPDSDALPTPPKGMSESEYHDWVRAARSAESYLAAQAIIGPSLFDDVRHWMAEGKRVREKRAEALGAERLLHSRQEESMMQVDDVLRKGAQACKELQDIAAERFAIDTGDFAEWEARIDAKRSLADDKMGQVQHQILLIDRRRAHLQAIRAHNDARERALQQRADQLARFRKSAAESRERLAGPRQEVEELEGRVARWTDILNRKETALAERERQLRAAKLASSPQSDVPPPPPPRFHHNASAATAAEFLAAQTGVPSARFRPMPAPGGRAATGGAEEIDMADDEVSPDPVDPLAA